MRTYQLLKHVFAVELYVLYPARSVEPLAVLARFVSLPFVPNQHHVIQIDPKTVEVAQLVAYAANPEMPNEEGVFEILVEPVLVPAEGSSEVIHNLMLAGWNLGESDVKWLLLVMPDEEDCDCGGSCGECDPDFMEGLDIEGIDLSGLGD